MILTSLLGAVTAVFLVQGTGFTALMFACMGGHLDTVKTLLEHGANSRVKNRVSHALRCTIFHLILYLPSFVGGHGSFRCGITQWAS